MHKNIVYFPVTVHKNTVYFLIAVHKNIVYFPITVHMGADFEWMQAFCVMTAEVPLGKYEVAKFLLCRIMHQYFETVP